MAPPPLSDAAQPPRLGHADGMRWRGAALIALSLLSARPAPATPAECIVLEDFVRSRDGEFPDGWRARKDAGRGVYSVRTENGVRYLHAAAKGLGIQAALEREWSLRDYPVLRWKWRPRAFPRGANEQSGKSDSALAVYAVFPLSYVAVRTVKYIWSEQVAKGTLLESSRGLTKGIVLESGAPADPGAWVEERANVAEDYKRRFNDGEPPAPLGIAVLTDSDDTGTYAEGDYADFRACRN